MELWQFVGGVLGAIGLAVAGLAHRHDDTWPVFRDRVYWTGTTVLGFVGVVGTCLWIALLFRDLVDQAGQVLSATFAICVCAAGVLAFTWIADRLRKPK